MAIKLGNFSIDEIVYGVGRDFQGNLLYTLDQLQNASIEITSESSDITDKKGNVVRRIYKSKQGTFNAENAFMNPYIMNNASGSDIKAATSSAPIDMPKIQLIGAGSGAVTLDAGVDATSIKVKALFANGINGEDLTKITTGTPTYDESTGTYTYLYDADEKKITVPASGTGKPLSYFVMYKRSRTEGFKMENLANKFPAAQDLTLYCSYVDPCDDQLRACYVHIPSFSPSPETTLNFNADEQTMAFNGNINVDYCATQPILFEIFLPLENAVKTAIVEPTT